MPAGDSCRHTAGLMYLVRHRLRIMQKIGAAQVARLRTFKEKGGNVQNYVIEHLVKKPAVMPAVEPQALARQS